MKRVLVADDRERNRYLLRTIIESKGWDCTEAADGEEALALARKAPPDLLITDVLMPRMDGFSLCRAWRADEQLRDIPLLIVSSTFNTARDEKLARDLGADGFLNHPVPPEVLLQEVRKLMNDSKAVAKATRTETSDDLIDDHMLALARKLEEKVEELENSNRELHAALQALREAESGRDRFKSELEQFFNLSPDLIFIVDRKLKLLQANPRWERDLGRDPDTLPGRSLLDFIHEEDREMAAKEFEAVFTSEESRRLQVRVRNGGESPKWVEFHLASFFNRRLFGIGHDVTQEKEALEQLQLRDTALRSAALGVVISRRNGTVVWVNPAFEAISGYSREELLGDTLEKVRSGKHPREFYHEIWEHVESGKVWKGEAISRRKGGSLYYEETMITPMFNEDGEVVYYIAFKEDITERKQREKQMVRSQRMESIGHLAGGLAHDLNNVLAPIALSIEMLRKGESSPSRRSMLEIMERSCARGADIIRQVLTFARGVEGEQVPVQMRHLVQELVAMVGETFPPDIHIVPDYPRDLWLVQGDATQLHQVLLNLAVNARDAMPNGGELRFELRNRVLESGRENLGLNVDPGRYVEVTVTDTGVGIDEDHIDQIFEPFFTTKEEGKGTGLGLPTVLGIIRSHGGMLEVSSERGKGTTFRFLVPVAKTEAALPSVEAEWGEAPSGSGETVLVVDDEEAVLKITQAILEDAGYRFLGARDGAEGVATYASHSHEIAVVITDVIMPVMHGAAMTASLQRINPDVKIIASSGFSEESGVERVEEMRAMGVKTVLKKPYTADALLRAVHETLHS